MTFFTRFLLFEIFKPLVLLLTAFTGLILVGLVLERAVAEGLVTWSIAKLIPYLMPIAMQMTIPFALLLAVCVAYGKLSADNELTAIKSCGISPWAFIKPTVILGLCLSPLAVWLTDLAGSWGRPGMQQVVMHAFEEIVYRVLRTQGSYNNQKGFSIVVSSVEGPWLIRPVITIFNEDRSSSREITADKARLELDPIQDQLLVEVVNYRIESDEGVLAAEGTDILRLSLQQTTRKGRDNEAPSQYALNQIRPQAQLEHKKLVHHEQTLAAHLATALQLGRIDLFADGTSQQMIHARDQSQQRLSRLKSEPWRRWAAGFGCFFFVWCGLPLAVLMRTADYSKTILLCIVPIFFVYFPIFGLTLNEAKSGNWPGYTMWVANLVALAVGALMMRPIYRH
jgi:lipopolysaccharide export system permease protein